MITLVTTRSEKTTGVFVDQLQKQKGKNGVCMLTTRRYDDLVLVLNKKGIVADKLLFIDACSQVESGNVLHTSLEDLTLLGIVLGEAAQALPGDERFILFESFGTLTLYNEPKVVAKFGHFLCQQMREAGVDCVIILGVDSVDGQLLATLKQCADTVEEK